MTQVSLDKSNLAGRIKYRLRWHLRTKRVVPSEARLWAAPEIVLKIKRPETGNFVLRAQKRFGARDGLLLFEPAETVVFLERVKRASIFFDLGAHIGYYSLIAASHGNIKHVVALEILPNLADEISYHADNNGLRNILVQNTAVGDGTRVIEFGNFTAKNQQKTTRLDELVAVHKLQPDLIKIDIEGFEDLALRGAAKTLNSSPDLMLSVHPPLLSGHGASAESLIKELWDRYDHIYQIETGSASEMGSSTDILKRFRPERIPEEGFVLWCSRDDLL